MTNKYKTVKKNTQILQKVKNFESSRLIIINYFQLEVHELITNFQKNQKEIVINGANKI